MKIIKQMMKASPQTLAGILNSRIVCISPSPSERAGVRTAFGGLVTAILMCLSMQAFSQSPAIASFSPASGPVGTLVTIAGTNLSSPTAFTIGGVSAIVVSDNGDTLVGMVMPGAATGPVSVTTAGGTATGSGSFTITATSFPHVQQGSKLVGTGAVDSAYQGWSVCLSADGNTAIVGGPYDNGLAGAAWIYTRPGGTWTQQGSKLVGTGAVNSPFGAYQGSSVALSADGNTAIVGGYNDSGSAGAAWIFIRSGGTWTQQGSKLVGTGAVGSAFQGFSVSLSADGNTAIVGGLNDSATGAAWIYTRAGGTWTQQGSKLVGTGAGAGTEQGCSVSLSADGNTAIMGGLEDDNGAGAVWVFTRSGGTWTQQGSKLVGTGAVDTAYQGYSVSLSADGNTAIVGGNGDNSYTGAVWVFTRSGGTWTQQGSKLVGTGYVGQAYQGQSLSLSADGNTAIVGGYADSNYTGAVWVFTRSGGSWTQQGSKIVGTGASGIAAQAWSVSLSADGSTAIEGGNDDNNAAGAAWVFVSCSPDSSNLAQSICQGDTFVFGAQNLTAPGVYIDTLTNVYGCNSIITLTLTVLPNSATSISDSICQGFTYAFNGQNLSYAGTYHDTLTSANGCDSIITLILAVYSCSSDSTVVWPGDADDNHVVNNLDLLPIGLAYDSTGPARLVQGIVWQADSALDWADTLPGYSPSVNFKYADCNGDGAVNANDTLAIIANYGLTHAKNANPLPGPWRNAEPGINIRFTNDTLYNDSIVIANIYLGDSSTPVSNIYGLAFTINYDPMVTDSLPYLTFLSSWLGNNANSIHIAVVDQASGTVQAAITGINHAPRSGYGQIAVFGGEITTGNINGKDLAYWLNKIYISGVTAIDEHGVHIPLNAGIDTNYVGFYPDTLAGIRNVSIPTVSIYPNPAATQVRVSADAVISRIAITDILGETVKSVPVHGRKSEVIDISALAEGVYVVHVSAAGGSAAAKLVVRRD